MSFPAYRLIIAPVSCPLYIVIHICWLPIFTQSEKVENNPTRPFQIPDWNCASSYQVYKRYMNSLIDQTRYSSHPVDASHIRFLFTMKNAEVGIAQKATKLFGHKEDFASDLTPPTPTPPPTPNKMALISQTIASDAFSWMKNFGIFIKISLKFVLRVQLTITQH